MRYINYIILLYYWGVVARCKKLVDDPKSKFSTKATENLTLDEMDGVTDLEKVGRLLTCSPKELIKDLKHLRKVLDM